MFLTWKSFRSLDMSRRAPFETFWHTTEEKNRNGTRINIVSGFHVRT